MAALESSAAAIEIMSDQPKIFVVDDEEAVRGALCRLLGLHGFAVLPFSDAESFLATNELSQEGVVIIDLAMPGMSGEELLRKLKASASTLACVVITGVADVQMAVRVMEGGAVTLLEKPFTESELLDAIKKALVQSRALAETANRRMEIQRKVDALSDEEKIVLDGILTNKTVRFCANRLQVSTRTVERLRKSILDRFGVTSLVELAVMINTINHIPPTTRLTK